MIDVRRAPAGGHCREDLWRSVCIRGAALAFYSVIFGGSLRSEACDQGPVLFTMGLKRLGEYVNNECV